MRRRLLLRSSKKYVFSASTTATSVTSGSGYVNINITSTIDGVQTGYTVVSYESPVTAVTIVSAGVTIRYGNSTSTVEKSGSVVLKQNGSNKTIIITVTQAPTTPKETYEAMVVYRGDPYPYNLYYMSSMSMGVTDEGTITYKPSWITATYSAGTLSVTAETANNSTTARKDTITVRIGDKSASVVIIQLPDYGVYNTVDGHKYVPIAGLKWAVEDVGQGYFGPTSYTTYKYGAGAEHYYIDSTGTGTGCHEYSNPLTSSQDSATQVMGGGWRMPTSAECQTLIDSTTPYLAQFGNEDKSLVFIDNNNNCIVLFFKGYGTGGSLITRLDYWTANSLKVMIKNDYDTSGVGTYISTDNCYMGYRIRGVHA